MASKGLLLIGRDGFSGSDDALREIMKGNITLESRDPFGSTPMHLAAQGNHVNVIRCLAEARAMIDIQDKDQQTPLHYASLCGRVEAIAELLALGANQDITDKEGRTPLDLAMQSGVCGSDAKSLLDSPLIKNAAFK